MTDEELQQLAKRYEDGIPDEELAQAQWVPGPYAWLLDVVDDWEAFAARVSKERTTPEHLVSKAIDEYLKQPA